MRTILWVAFLGAALAGSDIAAAQSIAAVATPPAPGQIAAIQEQLTREGYRPGVVNGVMTDETRRAIAAYQRRTGRTPDALAASSPAGGPSDPVARAQAGLQRLGMLDGRPDGVVGPQTRDAIIRFQASQHLAIDPRVSDSLLAALEQAGAAPPPAAASAAPPPAPAATASTAPAAAPTPAATAALPPAASASQPNSPAAASEATGRRPLPSWVNPPPIR
jgi:peptidoglycan hydrolase-like protein with peptidoglycan-binding domain